MEVFPASVALVIRALVVSARWAGRSRRLSLEQMTAAAEVNRVAALEARVAVLEDRLEQREAPSRSWDLDRVKSDRGSPILSRSGCASPG